MRPRREATSSWSSLFVNPRAVRRRRGPCPLSRATKPPTAGRPSAAGVDLLFAPTGRGALPRRVRHLGRPGRAGRVLEGDVAPRALPRRRHGVHQALLDRPAHGRLLRTEGRAAGGRHPAGRGRSRPAAGGRGRAHRPRRRRAGASLAQCLPLAVGARRPPWPCRARSRRVWPHMAREPIRSRPHARVLAAERGLTVDYVDLADFDGPDAGRRGPSWSDAADRQRPPRVTHRGGPQSDRRVADADCAP